jgi:hypothetical protein
LTLFREDEMHISIPEVNLGISKRRETQKAGILGAALKPPSGFRAKPGGGPGAKPPETDEFLYIKGVSFKLR